MNLETRAKIAMNGSGRQRIGGSLLTERNLCNLRRSHCQAVWPACDVQEICLLPSLRTTGIENTSGGRGPLLVFIKRKANDTNSDLNF